MLQYRTKYHRLDTIVAWWPTSEEQIEQLLREAPVVILWQCPLSLAGKITPFLCSEQAFQTPLLDLSSTEEDLWKGFEIKSCRYEIKKGQKTEHEILQNEELGTAMDLMNESIRRMRYRGPLKQNEWDALSKDHDIFLCKHAGQPVAVHVILKDTPVRAKLMLSATADRSDETLRGVIGPLNRLLHWHEIVHYKTLGFRKYDFGGCNLDKGSPDYPIARFKLSFGATVVSEPILYLSACSGIRLRLKTFSKVRSTIKSIPWPESWIKVVRSTPRLAALFR